MGKFRKKPIEIEAIQYVGGKNGNEDALLAFAGQALSICCYGYGHRIHIQTEEGTLMASPGDWIIRGVEGEIYPCKPSVFDATYEAVEIEN